MAITSNFTNIATTTRASKAWDPGAWDFVSGSAPGALVEYAANAPRITSSGLLVEESSTNGVTNPRAESATNGVIGSGGALPTNWAASYSTGTIEVIGSGTDNGWGYCDIDFSGSFVGGLQIRFEGAGTITAGTAQSWTHSIGIKLLSGDFTNISSVQLGWIDTNGSSGLADQLSSDIKGTLDSTHRRLFYSGTTAGGGGQTHVMPHLNFTHNASAVAVRLRIYTPQMENKGYPTSPVLPTAGAPAASTRNVDDIDIPSGAWSNDNDDGTLYINCAFNSASAGFPRIVYYGVDSNNRAGFERTSSGLLSGLINDGGASQFYSTIGTAPGVGDDVKLALGWATNDMALSYTGETQVTDVSGTQTLGASLLSIGADPGSAPSIQSAYFKDIRYWPRRLTNAELEALVGN